MFKYFSFIVLLAIPVVSGGIKKSIVEEPPKRLEYKKTFELGTKDDIVIAKGKVVLRADKNPDITTPVRYVDLVLLDLKGIKVGSTQSDENGDFSVHINPKETFIIMVSDKRYESIPEKYSVKAGNVTVVTVRLKQRVDKRSDR